MLNDRFELAAPTNAFTVLLSTNYRSHFSVTVRWATWHSDSFGKKYTAAKLDSIGDGNDALNATKIASSRSERTDERCINMGWVAGGRFAQVQ